MKNILSYINDQPGRLIAVIYIAPKLIKKGYLSDDKFIKRFGILLLLWDAMFLLKGKRPIQLV